MQDFHLTSQFLQVEEPKNIVYENSDIKDFFISCIFKYIIFHYIVGEWIDEIAKYADFDWINSKMF
jgi:hypothetical protein